jgi:hypothetical protein
MRIAWLIERRSVLWGTEWFCAGEDRWTKDANKAIQFPDKASAIEIERLIMREDNPIRYPYKIDGYDWEYTIDINDHGFMEN